MGWKKNTFLILAVISLAACVQPATLLTDEDTPTDQSADGSAQDDFFIVENALLKEGAYTVPPGEMVTLRWRIASGKKIYIKQTVQSGAGEEVAFGPLPSEDTLDVCPLPSLTQYDLYTGGNPDKKTTLSPDLSLMTHMEIDIDQPIDLEAACWGKAGDYLLSTRDKALMNDMVLLLWSVDSSDWVTIMTSYGTEPVDHYGALPPSGALAVCEQFDTIYRLDVPGRPSLQVTVSRADTAEYAANRAYGRCPYVGLVSWP